MAFQNLMNVSHASPAMRTVVTHGSSSRTWGPRSESSNSGSSRLSRDDAAGSRPRSSVNRIIEHEKALLPSPKRAQDGPSFQIIENSQSNYTDRPSPIASFPNEVLTHVLSHLPPTALSTVALVSHRFHSLVTTPHAWRVAFSRLFPGSDAIGRGQGHGKILLDRGHDAGSEIVGAGRRLFARLTALASWRSEYILRTRLLRSLGRGKPAQVVPVKTRGASPRSTSHQNNQAAVTYNSQLLSTVNHLHACFTGIGPNKRLPRFMHGADEVGAACSSDPNTGKVDNWGLSDPQSFLQFSERFPGDAQWGLGAGDIIGVPNVMDISQPFGVVYGEGSPGGLVYSRAADEQRGRFLAFSVHTSDLSLGIPTISGASESVCSVWIAKSASMLSTTEGLVGILSGSSSGIVTAYSMGVDGLRDQRLERGEVTARWVLSPGVPIVKIVVDEAYNLKRRARNRVWAVVLNALGEVFYLTEVPRRRPVSRVVKLNENGLDVLAWETGRTVHWSLVEPTRRTARIDPYDDSSVDGSYSPRSSWDGLHLTREQLLAETTEIERFIRYKPNHFRKVCEGWDMRRRLEVDFAGDDGCGGGEAIVVICCGLDEGTSAQIRRHTRCRSQQGGDVGNLPTVQDSALRGVSTTSLFGGAVRESPSRPSASTRSGSLRSMSSEGASMAYTEEWHTTDFDFTSSKTDQITTSTIDCSLYGTLAVFEDPLLDMSGPSNASSPIGSPLQSMPNASGQNDIPGHRARHLAIGTKAGSVILWEMRGPVSSTAELINTLPPVRVIHTDSPQISCLGLTALYLVHGGNDGLVQAWDPLASELQPIRTLNSRFSLRARRRLLQAENSPQGVGINLFAAGAICLDPDPTVLRGMVSLGTHLRYWSYSSSAADEYASRKRRHRRRSARGSNSGSNNGDPRNAFSARAGGSSLKDYIISEKHELERERVQRDKDAARLAGRFGVGLLGAEASDEETLAYARMLSEESLKVDEERRKSGSEEGSADSSTPSDTAQPRAASLHVEEEEDTEEIDPAIREAIRLSLLEQHNQQPPSSSVSNDDNQPIFSSAAPAPGSSKTAPKGMTGVVDEDDLDFALRLSLAEERSRVDVQGGLGESSAKFGGKGKGKGKERAE
ncbi:MAG: hypothetical protein M1817_005419 [Caeruleum heppii]|nr:MAG: hypothetical protein M1817_005419 [Caeruleum heppii]